MTGAVALRSGAVPALSHMAAEAASLAGLDSGADTPDLAGALELARRLGPRLPRPGAGETLALWESLATLGAVDLTVARVVEPHLDALAILAQAAAAGLEVPHEEAAGGVWGVYAAEGGGRLVATPAGPGWRLDGHKPWCSLADRVSHALVTAWVDDGRRGLFAVDLRVPGVVVTGDRSRWVSRGLAQVTSLGVDMEAVPALAVGGPGWYLERAGFWWGGIGVAAIWYGGAVGVARRVHRHLRERTPDQVGLSLLGQIDVALTRARAVLLEAAAVVDGADGDAAGARRLSLRCRQVVAEAAEEVLRLAGHATGPAPLTVEEDHARRVADLVVYLRQHHAERDAAALGQAVLEPTPEREWGWA